MPYQAMAGAVQNTQCAVVVPLMMQWHSTAAWAMIATGLVVFVLLMSGISAPYGRYSRRGWGVLMPPQLAWVTQELPSLLLPAALCALAGLRSFSGHWGSPRTALAAAFLLHYVHRSLLYPLLLQGGKPTPLAVWASAFAFCVCNGCLQGVQLACLLDPAAPWTPLSAAGMLVWLLGWLVNLHSDAVLRALRRPGETDYKVPRGGMFRLVSAANYTGEIIEWAGFALAVAGTRNISGQPALVATSFAFFTFCNLAPRGWQHHLWYLSKFEDYPAGRRAVLPFLW